MAVVGQRINKCVLGPQPKHNPGVLLDLQDGRLQQVADDLPGKEDVDIVESLEEVQRLLHS